MGAMVVTGRAQIYSFRKAPACVRRLAVSSLHRLAVSSLRRAQLLQVASLHRRVMPLGVNAQAQVQVCAPTPASSLLVEDLLLLVAMGTMWTRKSVAFRNACRPGPGSVDPRATEGAGGPLWLDPAQDRRLGTI
jgi:hypothetical protein